MAKYFSKYPKILHSFDGINGTLVTNLLARIKMADSVLTNTLIYYEYSIQEGDTPEIVANKLYKDSEKHWVVLLTNKIFDPFYEWPQSSNQFNKFIINKYGSLESALTTPHHYEKIVSSRDSYSGETTTKVYEIDLTSYNALPAEPTIVTRTFDNGISVTVTTSRRQVSEYDYESELNEKRRVIKLLKKEFIPQVEKELTALMAV